MARTISFQKAVNEALDQEMARDPAVVLFGEDVAGGQGAGAELMFVAFMGVCFDQIFNQGAKLRYMFGGKARVPMVIRTMWGAGIRAASQHSQSLYSIFTHVPGLKVAVRSTPYDAKGLLIAALRD